ncbi:MAG: hypothetical protein H7235_06720 [Bdellovibrionaceae bacterium]|nr:hypothetical protein [Pseudobdellovibrionaceae bacterium]
MKKLIKLGAILIVVGALLYLAGVLVELYATRTGTVPGFVPGSGPTAPLNPTPANPNPILKK